MKIILASASPRRKELLAHIVKDFEVVTATEEAEIDTTLPPRQAVLEVARQKGQSVKKTLEENENIIISADTIVVCEGEVLGKPENAAHAAEMLAKLSGKTQEIYTAVCMFQGDKEFSECVKTLLEFYPLSEAEIAEYVATGDPMDKAGAYGIQSGGMRFVKNIEGDYFNVVGFPVFTVHKMLKQIENV